MRAEKAAGRLSANKPERIWFLEGYLDSTRSLRRLPLNEFPYRMGRQEGLSLSLPSAEISRVHAEIDRDQGGLLIRDLGSTNGTFVNHEPVGESMALREGDIIHLASVELRLVAIDAEMRRANQTTRHGMGPLSENLPTGSRELQDLLLHEKVTAAFQPILTPAGEIHGWEILGRGAHPDLAESPMELFRIAESLGMEVLLSDIFRRKGLGLAAERHPGGLYFVNTHPLELDQMNEFLRNIEIVRRRHDDLGIVVELHEGAFAELKVLTALRKQLRDMNIGLAFDDFGAGQARLVELADAPPDYIKLDISLIRDIDKAPAARRDMVQMVVEYAKKLEIAVLAEGVSREGELAACNELGFDYLQGFHFGYPHPADELPEG